MNNTLLGAKIPEVACLFLLYSTELAKRKVGEVLSATTTVERSARDKAYEEERTLVLSTAAAMNSSKLGMIRRNISSCTRICAFPIDYLYT